MCLNILRLAILLCTKFDDLVDFEALKLRNVWPDIRKAHVFKNISFFAFCYYFALVCQKLCNTYPEIRGKEDGFNEAVGTYVRIYEYRSFTPF